MPQEVRQADIAEVVARRARIPLARLLESERERLLKLEARQRNVFGQPHAIAAVANAARQMRTDLRRTKRPLVSLCWPNRRGEDRNGQGVGRGAL